MSNYLMGQSSLLATPLSRNEIGDLGYVVGSAGSISAVAEVWKNTFAEINPVAKIASDMVASHSFLPKYVPDFSGILKMTECVPDFSGILKMPELMSGFSEILKASDFVSESMISVMKCSGIVAYQQGLLKEQLSILTASNVLPDMSKLMDKIYQEAYSVAGEMGFGWWLVEHYLPYHIDCPNSCGLGESTRGG